MVDTMCISFQIMVCVCVCENPAFIFSLLLFKYFYWLTSVWPLRLLMGCMFCFLLGKMATSCGTPQLSLDRISMYSSANSHDALDMVTLMIQV